MNATFAPPRTPTTVSIACPWCEKPLAVDDAFTATSVRCGACATSIDIEPAGRVAAVPSIDVAA